MSLCSAPRVFCPRTIHLLLIGLLTFVFYGCASTSATSKVADGYKDRSLAGGTLVIAPLQERDTTGSEPEFFGGEPVDSSYVVLLRDNLPAAIQQHTTFDEVVHGTYVGDPNLKPISYTLRNQERLWTSGRGEYLEKEEDLMRILSPEVGSNPVVFEDVEADYILFVRGIKVRTISMKYWRDMPTANGGFMSVPVNVNEVSHKLHFLLWDNRNSTPIMTGGGSYDDDSNGSKVPEDKGKRLAMIDGVAAKMLKGSPFHKEE